jgi:hypothetical protein
MQCSPARVQEQPREPEHVTDHHRLRHGRGEGVRRGLNPSPRAPRTRVLPLHHGHHRERGPDHRPAPQRKGRESNPQGSALARSPGGSRPRSGGPSVSSVPVGDAGVEPAASSVSCWRSGRLSEPPVSSSAPTRTRTRDSSLGPRYDPPLHHRGVQRKARDSNPHALAGALVSTEARPAVSGYLPFQWTHRESNPDLRHARATSSPWTMGPSITDSAEWTAGESNPDLRRAMPVSSRWTSSPFVEWNRPESAGRFARSKVRPRIELGPPPYQGGVLPEHLQTGFLGVVPAGLEPALSCL